MTDPWGADEPPADTGPIAPLPPRLARLAEIQATGITLTHQEPYAEGFPEAAELPEVQVLLGRGWQPLDPAPLYCLLPAAWPSAHRTWVPDRLPRVGLGGTTDTYWNDIVALPDDDDWAHELRVEQARAVGLADPPANRIWLMRSPWPAIPVGVIYEIVWSIVQRAREEDEIGGVYRVALEVMAWDEDRAWAAVPTDTRGLLDAWAAAGRVGQAAASMVERRLRPGELADALARTGLDEPTLLAWLASLPTDLDDDTIAFIKAWRTSGLPGDPPPGAHRYLDRDPVELRTWLTAGFDLFAAYQLRLAGLATAVRWRDAGFNEADTYELLRSDPALTSDEALAFDRVGPARERRREWIYYGFTADRAEVWSAAGLTPAQARLWRACGLEPADVRPGQQFPPQLFEGRRHIAFHQSADGERSNSEWDARPDPPGTRGRRARRRAGDDDPWINTD